MNLKIPINASHTDTYYLIQAIPPSLKNLQLNNINVEFAKLFTTSILNIESLEMINQTNRKKPYDENEI